MTSVVPDRRAVRQALERESERVADLVRDAAPLDGSVPGLDWTRAQLIAHLCAISEAWATTLRGEDFVGRFGAQFVGSYGTGSTLPEAVAAINARVLADVWFPGSAEAADALITGSARLLEAFDASPDLKARQRLPWYGPEVTMPVGNLLALAVSEILVHGYDLARAVGANLRPSEVTAESAAAVAAATMSEMLPRMVDQHGASGFTGGFEVRIRRGQRFVLHIGDGTAWCEAAEGQHVDCVLTLSAYHALLVGYGRMPLWRGIATGKAWASGRRPWLGPRFREMFLTA
jgi:uncharacterized protein (TIGR03083 family)